MNAPFRDHVDAIRTRLTSLDEELATLRARAREYEAVRERLAQVEREHEDLRRELAARSARPPVPFLDTLRVASPCNESWDAMAGDDRTRFCGKCQKNVHNISELTRAEAEAFLQSIAGSACIRMYKRADGTLLTADCPVGVRKKRVKRLFLATIGGGLAAAAGALAFWRHEETVVMGEIEPVAMGQLQVEHAPQPTAPQPTVVDEPAPTAHAYFANDPPITIGTLRVPEHRSVPIRVKPTPGPSFATPPDGARPPAPGAAPAPPAASTSAR